MIRKRMFLLFFCYGIVIINSLAQEINIKSISVLINDLEARTKERLDNNGVACALIKIDLPQLDNVTFSGAMGSVEHRPGQYLVYVPSGTKRIKMFHKDYAPLLIDFSAYSVSINEKTTYQVLLSLPILNKVKNNVYFKVIPEIQSSEQVKFYLNDEEMSFADENTELSLKKGTYYYYMESELAVAYNKFQVFNEDVVDTVFIHRIPNFLVIEKNGVLVNDSLEAMDYYKANVSNDTSCMVNLSWSYSDYNKSRELVKLAADKGNAIALFNYAYYFSQDEERRLYYERAAQKGNRHAIAMLGIYHENSGNIKEAIHCFYESAMMQSMYGQFNLSNVYLGNGFSEEQLIEAGIEFNRDKGLHFLRKSALNGYALAQDNLGLGYLWGPFGNFGLPYDIDKAIYWFEKAAKQGHYRAMYNLGDAYRRSSDFTKSIEYYKMYLDKIKNIDGEWELKAETAVKIASIYKYELNNEQEYEKWKSIETEFRKKTNL